MAHWHWPHQLVARPLRVAEVLSQQLLATSFGQNSAPRWTPDGNRIVFVTEHDGDSEVFVMDRHTLQVIVVPIAQTQELALVGAGQVHQGLDDQATQGLAE